MPGPSVSRRRAGQQGCPSPSAGFSCVPWPVPCCAAPARGWPGEFWGTFSLPGVWGRPWQYWAQWFSEQRCIPRHCCFCGELIRAISNLCQWDKKLQKRLKNRAGYDIMSTAIGSWRGFRGGRMVLAADSLVKEKAPHRIVSNFLEVVLS